MNSYRSSTKPVDWKQVAISTGSWSSLGIFVGPLVAALIGEIIGGDLVAIACGFVVFVAFLVMAMASAVMT